MLTCRRKFCHRKVRENDYKSVICIACEELKAGIIPGMEVIKIGGPIYRIGVGGGAASSIEVVLSFLSNVFLLTID